MSKRSWAVVAALAVALAAGARLAATGQGPKPEPKQPAAEAPFKGKVVLFALRKDPQKTTALQDARVRRLGEVDFLTGLVVGSSGGDWRINAVVWVPVADLYEVVEFKDLREAKRVVRLVP